LIEKESFEIISCHFSGNKHEHTRTAAYKTAGRVQQARDDNE